ncbi:glycosyltransferase [Nocardioides sp. LHD-245]|uniref:glycosyltransferase n=1 Tax=Nocardioides sp. LHD-245 TaxID=3051387 RepID=UPI0027E09E51|nr:glycosyltransferase [Nocardioides sp. LHD-245]
MPHGEIVMAVHRPDPELLRRQLESLRAQTVRTWTCRIGIDGADAAAESLIRHLVGDDPRFVVHAYADNVGVYRHVERMLREVTADAVWVALSDQDDHWHDDKVERLLAALTSGPALATAATCQAALVDRDGVHLGRTDRRPGDVIDLLLRNHVTGSLTLWRGDVVAAALPFPGATDASIHDHWLAVCAAGLGEVRLVDEVLQDYVQHGGNLLGEVGRTTFRSELRAARNRGGLRAHLDHAARHRWQWRVAMASGLVDRGIDQDPVVADIAAGRVSGRLLRRAGRSVVQGRLRLRGAVGVLVAATWSRGAARP